MGMQDRDYYREHKREQEKTRTQTQAPTSARGPSTFWGGLPDVPGASWHWVTKVLVWLAVMAVLFFTFKVFERKRDETARLQRHIAQQQAVIEEQRRQIEALKPKPKVDFFK